MTGYLSMASIERAGITVFTAPDMTNVHEELVKIRGEYSNHEVTHQLTKFDMIQQAEAVAERAREKLRSKAA